MAAHSVKMLVEHPLNVGTWGVEFKVRKGEKLLGKLQISRTSIDWTPAKARNPCKASWQDFGDWMEGKGAGAGAGAGARRNGPPRGAVVVAPSGSGAADVADGGPSKEADSADHEEAESAVLSASSEPSELSEPRSPWEGRY